MKLVEKMLLAATLALAGTVMAAEKAAGVGDAGGGIVTGADTAQLGGDDEWACKVAMCMANPGGPTEFAECQPPIERLRRHLAKGNPFPVCRFLGGGEGQAGDGGRGRTSPDERDPLQAL